jgi:hypothetical protein
METKLNKKRKPGNAKGLRSVSGRIYAGFKLEDVVYRPNALTVLNAPSRYGSMLIYPPQYNKESTNG